MKRRIATFSERDHVMFKFVPIGHKFIWRGNVWQKHTEHKAVLVAGPYLGSHGVMPKMLPRRRVIVTRVSGLARMVAHQARDHFLIPDR